MKKILILAAALLTLPNAGMTAQEFPDGLTMACTTADGVVLISEQGLDIADYNFRFGNIPEDGIAQLTDSRSKATAVLDARSDDGLYIEIHEGGETMLVVVDRDAITYSFDRSAARPSSPQLSSRFVQSMYDARSAGR